MPESYEKFYRDEYQALVVFVRSLGAQHADAEDIASEAIDQARRSWSTLRTPRNWVRKAAYHEFLKHKHRVRKERAYGRLLVPDNDRDDAPGTRLEGEELVRQALMELTFAQAAVFALKLDDYTTEEIAEILSIVPATVRSHYRHALAKLRRGLPRHGRDAKGDHKGGQDAAERS